MLVDLPVVDVVEESGGRIGKKLLCREAVLHESSWLSIQDAPAFHRNQCSALFLRWQLGTHLVSARLEALNLQLCHSVAVHDDLQYISWRRLVHRPQVEVLVLDSRLLNEQV
eukprot:CAMPEP_0181246112 /NCGR_PEP_ID=MMETSP1096-20121128/43825_1 /TAXON_ID=156174 ORGANISM="Chrysochromulina ericina, Strain CCMP281" /NCGR_SAMPLE_ID=MMETSP1096 /ASSEMBLY_ACC=CAM_ASM_000453 /LENGTH=111 /DNA_ID=CAMNT_0023342917 /DNA_START=951 /DNA_END=1286 /DNA_ORIENTATION=+